MNHTLKKPSRFAQWMLGNMSGSDERLFVLGDFEEIYNDIYREQGKFRASYWYWSQLIKSIPSFLKSFIYWRSAIFKYYFKIALRNFKRNKGYSFINISGLAVGIACCILILLWVQDELSYDRFHEKGNRIFKVTIESHLPNGKIDPFTHTQFPLAPALKEKYPEIVNSTRIFQAKVLVKHESKAFNDERFFFSDPSFFEMFTFPLVNGSQETALSGINSIVITENIAQKYFGKENPIGKTMSVNIKRNFVVTGVMKNIPTNSHIQFDFLAPSAILENLDQEMLRQEFDARSLHSWGATYVDTYVLLRESSSYKDVEQKISGFLNEVKSGTRWRLKMQPLYQVYLFPINGSNTIVKYLTIFSIVAFVVLMIACFNFINLTTAYSSKRSKEIGMRKILGSPKGDIAKQFIGEALLLSFCSLILAVFLVFLFLPTFNELIGKKLSLFGSFDLTLLSRLIGITLLTGCLSAIYPALLLSSLRPVGILKGFFKSGSKKPLFRRFLVVVQFSLSIILIIGTIIVYSQLDFIRKRDLGYNKENIIYLPLQGKIQNKYQLLKNEMGKNPYVLNTTVSNVLPSCLDTGAGGIDWEGKDPGIDAVFYYASIDYDFIETFQMKIVQGRNFSRKLISDRSNYILNETAIREMGLNTPIGKRFSMWRNREGKIIGIIKDFNFKPLRKRIKPLILTMDAWPCTYIFIRTASENFPSTLNYLKSVWKRLNPGYPFDYHFLDEDFDSLYIDEQRMGRIFGYFTFLAIFIACFGLYGLVAFITDRKTKEIGIRKVFGASVKGITVMLSQEFTKWVLLANLVAWPVSYFLMFNWLENFAYRTNIKIWMFFVSAAVALAVALLTVSYKSVKAALAKPVDSLRYE